ncbi:sigma-70 family RNA polymerase sigma factor [Mesorhizobium sp.]|uniref:sigma-70 family RNA polymerase sigma factor n=1 Tax=Mesorhizobium sp. TaxID=1871066 RepID=UPI00120AB755|nr:sigma-70 family RNA polymerase sigma factor [Mesorhizobium sp.]TIX28834.1 MAG: sigma-70 family RNA polymerase sigma factor [Mesorhizobium sp.]
MTPVFLTREDEYALAVRWRDHRDVAAMQKIVATHQPLVFGFAHKFRRFKLPTDDMVQEGSIGLMTALNRFDPDLGNRFSTFARWYVIAALQDFILANFSVVKGSTSSKNRMAFFAGQRAVDASMDASIYEDGESWTDRLVDGSDLPDAIAEAVIDGERQSKIIRQALKKLSPRSAAIVKARVMLDEPETLESLGRKYGISKERIRQIEAKGLEDLRKALTSKRRRLAVGA